MESNGILMNKNKKFKVSHNVTGAQVSLSVDTKDFFKGFSLTQRRLDELKLEAARMVIPYYRRLILRTPVWRGTARLNWYLNVDKFANKSGRGANRRSGRTRKNIIDSEITKVANKAGEPRSAKTMVTSYWGDIGGERRRNGKTFKLIGTQSQYGVMTTAVRDMIESARRNIEQNFKVTHGGPDSLFQKRSAEVSVITISNDLPYIKFLEGPSSPFGAAYTKGSIMYAEKQGKADFVNPGAESTGADPDSLGSYRQGFVMKATAQLRGEFTRFMSTKKPSDYKIR